MGILLLPNSAGLSSTPLFALRCPVPVLSNVWWPAKWKRSRVKKEIQLMERRAALWFNSTFGIILTHALSPETGVGFKKMPKAWWENSAFMIDLTKLNKTQLKILDDCWKTILKQDFSRYSDISSDPVRKEIDEAWCKILKVPNYKLVILQ